ncbi:hypothetical protein [Halomonas halocynthiae]|uniref:hypothetical protein n=1 Tax=Halomonas halocynthiae TaxID=176290 RepID=UPI0003F4D1AF|nr:hypothetical protein [Halomonas halocynthiae]
MTTETAGTTALPSGELEILRPDALVEKVKADNPKLAEKLNDKQLVSAVRGTLKALAAEINGREEGRLRVAGLGRVVIREVEREKDGEMIRRKRVVLHPAQPKV